MTGQELQPYLVAMGIAITLGWNVYQATVGRQKVDQALQAVDQAQEARLSALETKMGLFWRLVEEHMTGLLAKSNPIHLEPDEKAAALIYDTYKRKAPTKILKTLEIAIERELGKHYLSVDEIHVFVMLLGAIQSQLYDRNEWVP